LEGKGDEALVDSRDFLEKVIFYNLVDLLSNDAQMVVRGLVDGEFQKPEMTNQWTIGRFRVYETMHKELGWDQDRVYGAWNEVQDWYKEYIGKSL
jgi:hypothetical protein